MLEDYWDLKGPNVPPVGEFPCKLMVKKKFSDLIYEVTDVLEDRLRMRLSESCPRRSVPPRGHIRPPAGLSQAQNAIFGIVQQNL